jgi:hypothetical protein
LPSIRPGAPGKMPVQSPARPHRRAAGGGGAAAPAARAALALGLLLLADAAAAAGSTPFQRPLPPFVGRPRKSRPPALDFASQVVGGATAPMGRCACPGRAAPGDPGVAGAPRHPAPQHALGRPRPGGGGASRAPAPPPIPIRPPLGFAPPPRTPPRPQPPAGRRGAAPPRVAPDRVCSAPTAHCPPPLPPLQVPPPGRHVQLRLRLRRQPDPPRCAPARPAAASPAARASFTRARTRWAPANRRRSLTRLRRRPSFPTPCPHPNPPSLLP